MIETGELQLTAEDHEKAFTEVSFLLEIFADTITDLMGGATATVGRIAGRHIAEKLPFYLPNPTTEAVLEALVQHMRDGYQITYTCDPEGADLTFGHCAICDVCRARNQELGGDLCKMFHYSIGGIVNQLMDKPVKGSIEKTGDTCVSRLTIRSE